MSTAQRNKCPRALCPHRVNYPVSNNYFVKPGCWSLLPSTFLCTRDLVGAGWQWDRDVQTPVREEASSVQQKDTKATERVWALVPCTDMERPLLKSSPLRGTWEAQSVRCLPLAQVMVPGSWDPGHVGLPAQRGVCFPLPRPLTLLVLSVN